MDGVWVALLNTFHIYQIVFLKINLYWISAIGTKSIEPHSTSFSTVSFSRCSHSCITKMAPLNLMIILQTHSDLECWLTSDMVLTGMYPSATMKTGKTTGFISSKFNWWLYSLITVSRNASNYISHTCFC